MDLRPLNPYYRQPLQAVSGTGTSGRKKGKRLYIYPYTWQEPVTDRTQEDVEHARQILALDWADMNDGQKGEYLAGLKGCLNREDLVRIENNIQILLDVLETGTESSVGNIPDIPDTAYFTRMQNNVGVIREACCVHTSTPAVPALPYNTWQKINDIEQILADVYEVVSSQFHYYAGGEIHSGDMVGLVL